MNITPLSLLSLGVIALCTTTATADQLSCSFDTECLDTDGCSETTYEATITYSGDEGMAHPASKSDISGDTEGQIEIRDGISHYTSGAFHTGMSEALTVTESGDARMVVTLGDVPMVITYAGTCEVAP